MIKVKDYIKEGTLEVKVCPNSKENKVKGVGDKRLKISIKEKAEGGKANKELLKFLKKKFNLRCRIKRGLKSRKKVLEIIS